VRTHVDGCFYAPEMRPIEETTVLITGATDGLGRGVARDLAARGAKVLLHGRSREKLDELSAELGDAPTFQADLSSLDEVRKLAAEVEAQTDALHVLINNAGIGGGAPDGTTRQESKDGHELRLAVNHLAGFLLTLRLLPLLRRSKPARVVFVASLGQAPMDFDDPMLERGYSGSRAYGQSKLAQITTGFELAERLDPNEVTVTSLHPSTYMPTKMVLEARGSSVDTLEAGIEATSRLAVDPELEGVTGRFYDRQRESTPDPQASDEEQRKRLWALSLELVGEPEPAL
jgi:NAD(P)-dependent dehydrogenase (short-subunit alcohol dehydrogenase family)